MAEKILVSAQYNRKGNSEMKMLLTMILAVLVLASMAILPAFAD